MALSVAQRTSLSQHMCRVGAVCPALLLLLLLLLSLLLLLTLLLRLVLRPLLLLPLLLLRSGVVVRELPELIEWQDVFETRVEK